MAIPRHTEQYDHNKFRAVPRSIPGKHCDIVDANCGLVCSRPSHQTRIPDGPHPVDPILQADAMEYPSCGTSADGGRI